MPDRPAAFQPNQQGITCRPVETQLAGLGRIFSRRFHNINIWCGGVFSILEFRI